MSENDDELQVRPWHELSQPNGVEDIAMGCGSLAGEYAVDRVKTLPGVAGLQRALVGSLDV